MQFVSLLPVRDEADIIGQCLEHQLTWADAIYVFDTGSVDNTWEIIQDFAGRDRRVKPLRKDPVYFNDTVVRGWIFHQARQRMRNGDWFLRCDADEFHHIAPPEFVKTRMRKHETIAWHQYYNFCLLESEARAWEAGKESLADRARPIEQRRQWYQVSVYAEPRLCLYRDTMRWHPANSFPFNAGFVARERLPIRHYPHRDPVQLGRRCRLRGVMMADKRNLAYWKRPELHHWSEVEWQKFITPDETEELKRWCPGTNLAEVRQFHHLAKPHIRAVQRVAHAFLLPWLDNRRPGWPEDAYPQSIPPMIVKRLIQELD